MIIITLYIYIYYINISKQFDIYLVYLMTAKKIITVIYYTVLGHQVLLIGGQKN